MQVLEGFDFQKGQGSYMDEFAALTKTCEKIRKEVA